MLQKLNNLIPSKNKVDISLLKHREVSKYAKFKKFSTLEKKWHEEKQVNQANKESRVAAESNKQWFNCITNAMSR